MEFYQMRCPNCNANLDVESGIDTFYCKYCGTKILIQGRSKTAIRANTLLKIVDKVKDSIDEERKYNEEHREEIEAREEKARREERRSTRHFIIGFVAFFAIMMAAIMLMEYIPEKKENDRLNSIYAEVAMYMAVGDYDNALMKANTIHWTATHDKTKEASWDYAREAVIRQIRERMNEQEQSQYITPSIEAYSATTSYPTVTPYIVPEITLMPMPEFNN